MLDRAVPSTARILATSNAISVPKATATAVRGWVRRQSKKTATTRLTVSTSGRDAIFSPSCHAPPGVLANIVSRTDHAARTARSASPATPGRGDPEAWIRPRTLGELLAPVPQRRRTSTVPDRPKERNARRPRGQFNSSLPTDVPVGRTPSSWCQCRSTPPAAAPRAPRCRRSSGTLTGRPTSCGTKTSTRRHPRGARCAPACTQPPSTKKTGSSPPAAHNFGG